MSLPRSTYRVQLRPEFGFDDVAAIAQYLADLGISHVYASPYLQAAPGSTHGYDVVDHSKVNDELGGAEAHARMGEALKQAGLGQILDIVPNHMAIPGRQNKWWWDILENGHASEYASYFDIDWNPPEGKLRNLVLMPVLGDHYGRVLEAGELKLAQSETGAVVKYYDAEFPINAATLQDAGGDIDAINNDVERLDALLEQQHYRLAFWRIAGAELDYRRFFDINTLVGLRQEQPQVFADTHRLALQWINDGVIDGVRIDHIDGLRDPLGYLRQLREEAGEDAYIVVEKIVESEERLPASWPIAGTTGYEAMNRVGGLFVQPDGERAITQFYADFTGESTDWDDMVRQGKQYVVNELLSSDVDRLTNLFAKITDAHRRYRDYSRAELRNALKAMLVGFPVYRSYVVAETHQVTRADEEAIETAKQFAAKHFEDIDADLLDFLASILTLRVTGDNEGELAMRFQQLSGPVMAKGVEDTAFYRYNRLVVLNEVGGNPGQWSLRPDDFHEANAEVQRLWPLTMNASTTHDTKRSEDVRYRLAVLAEIPEQWEAAVRRWSAINARHRRAIDPRNPDAGHYPDRNTEYLLYETLVGAYPLSADRLAEYAAKATKEAKVHTKWTEPNPAYDDALRSFIDAICSDRDFLADLHAFVEPIIEPGRATSLAATLVKLTMPGMPDTYQGTELWDLSLVDPDNRRPVDYDERRALLHELNDLSIDEISARSDEGLTKLHLVHQTLALRNRRPECFDQRSTYEPVLVRGNEALRTVAYRRGDVVTVVPRFVGAGSVDWSQTEVELPTGEWNNVLTGERYEGGGAVSLAELFGRFPVALLESNEGSNS